MGWGWVSWASRLGAEMETIDGATAAVMHHQATPAGTTRYDVHSHTFESITVNNARDPFLRTVHGSYQMKGITLWFMWVEVFR